MNTFDELFDIPSTLSPRLEWITENGVIIRDNGTSFEPGDEDEFGNTLHRFVVYVGKPNQQSFWDINTGWGDTEDEAIVEFCRKTGIRLWNEEDFK